MGIYRRYIGPRLVTCLCGQNDIALERQKVVPQAEGVVLEIGIGPGLNLEYYNPERVTQVIGVDPSASFLALGAERHETSCVPLKIIEAPAEDLPIAAATIDTAVITYTLCSVDDPAAALREVKRVLKPGGRALFLEHGLATDARVASWQQKVNPIWRRLAVGCNLNRPVAQLFDDAGFRLTRVEYYYLEGKPKALGYISAGEAQVA